jgi:hypothetical protein
VELVESAPDVDFSLPVFSLDEKGNVLLETASPCLPFLYADRDLGLVGEDGTGLPQSVCFVKVELIVVSLLVGVH